MLLRDLSHKDCPWLINSILLRHFNVKTENKGKSCHGTAITILNEVQNIKPSLPLIVQKQTQSPPTLKTQPCVTLFHCPFSTLAFRFFMQTPHIQMSIDLYMFFVTLLVCYCCSDDCLSTWFSV